MHAGYQLKFDAAEAAFTALALTYVESQVYETVLPPLEGRLYVPVDNKTPPGAKSVRYRMFTRTGIAQVITGDTDDLPTVALFVREYPHDVRDLGQAYQYSYFDVLAAGMASANGGPPVNLDLEDAIAAREGIERKLDRIAAFGSESAGDPDLGMVGLLNLPNATLYALAPGASGLVPWASKTPDEIIADLTGIIAAQIAATFKAFQPTRIILPILQHQKIAGMGMGDGRSDTVLSYFVETRRKAGNPVDVHSWQYCSGAGVGGKDRMVAYDPNPRYVRHMMALEFQQMPPQLKGLKYKTNCIARSAGVVSPYPVSVSFADGL